LRKGLLDSLPVDAATATTLLHSDFDVAAEWGATPLNSEEVFWKEKWFNGSLGGTFHQRLAFMATRSLNSEAKVIREIRGAPGHAGLAPLYTYALWRLHMLFGGAHLKARKNGTQKHVRLVSGTALRAFNVVNQKDSFRNTIRCQSALSAFQPTSIVGGVF
jgi:hypothetical protein